MPCPYIVIVNKNNTMKMVWYDCVLVTFDIVKMIWDFKPTFINYFSNII